MSISLLLLVTVAVSQSRSKRLILKDGSFQSVKQWEVKKDRVRYYSTERFMWEELPSQLVDWAATEKFNRDLEAGAEEQGRALAEADRQELEAQSPTVAAGLRLPSTGGVFLLDEFDGNPQLVELVQNGSDINKETGKNILRSIINPLPNVKQSLELRGARARVQSHVLRPAIFVNVVWDDRGEAPTVSKLERFRFVRVKPRVKNKKRVVGNLKFGIIGGMKEQRDVVPAQAEAFTSEWVKLVPAQPMTAGEYALIEMLTPEQMNLYVWDFGVDPRAPQNATAWKPAEPKKLPTGTEETPVLTNRPK